MVQESLIEGIFRSLRKNAGWATLIVGLAVCAAFILNRYAPTIYQSESLLRVMTTENTNEISLAATMQGILSQRKVVEEISKKCGIEEDNIRREEVITFKDAGPGLVSLAVRHENPVQLKELGSAVIQVLSEHFLGYNSEAQEFAVKALQNKLNHLETSISDLKQELVKASISSTVKADEQTLDTEIAIHQLEEKIDLNGQRLQTTPEEVFYYQEEETPEYQKMAASLKSERNQLAELFKSYKEKHPRVIACRNRISNLESNLAKGKTRVRKKKNNPEYLAIAAEISSDREKLAMLKNQFATERASISNEEKSTTGSADTIAMRISTLEELHRKTILELEESKITHTTTAGRINVLKKDVRPPTTVGFTSIQRDCLALASGVLMAIFLLYSPAPMKAELISVSGNILAGAVPAPNHLLLTSEPAEIILEAPSLTREPLALPAPVQEEDETSRFDERLIALNDPTSENLKPFKNLVSNLQISMSESQTRIVLVGSARTGAGRTTLLANTAILLAQTGYSVLMIDANFRNPELHRMFNLNNNHGLADLLNGGNLRDAMQATEIPNLSLISAGISPNTPAEALGSPEMIELLTNLKRRVEIILIDTAALLEYPETAILAGQTGAMVFLHRESESEDNLHASRKILNGVRAKILGYVKI
ncbi:MAG: polysaccharide biosynthesis tyrosine autokinase [Candidatus Riflebacteria bacterium]|nr:polysaccharide biosynthesis tyrosine autokinase [Candidatus Riflebacteria bacterium]